MRGLWCHDRSTKAQRWSGAALNPALSQLSGLLWGPWPGQVRWPLPWKRCELGFSLCPATKPKACMVVTGQLPVISECPVQLRTGTLAVWPDFPVVLVGSFCLQEQVQTLLGTSVWWHVRSFHCHWSQ